MKSDGDNIRNSCDAFIKKFRTPTHPQFRTLSKVKSFLFFLGGGCVPSLKLVFIFLDKSVYSAYLDVCEFLFMRTAHQENMQYLECMPYTVWREELLHPTGQ